jgi:ferritin-like metal-binding protein YciE
MPDREEALHGYVTDMLALEEHIQKAVRGQLEALDTEQPDVIHHLRHVLSYVERHIEELKQLDERIDSRRSRLGEVVKRAGSMVAGLGAAAIDLVRTEKLPRNLRDDYTAASLAYAGYLMLLTTASAFEDHDTARLASGALGDYAQVLGVLQELIPSAVVFQLRTEGYNVFEDAAVEATARAEGAWQDVGERGSP